jgi:L-lactate dehydrogenase (cytochrome)
MVERQLSNPTEIFELMKFEKSEFDGRKRRLESTPAIYDVCAIAKLGVRETEFAGRT